MLEFEIENNPPKDDGKIRITESSINANPELKENKIYYLRISLIIINIISAISGIYIFQNKQYYLSQDYKFEYHDSLQLFIILYSFGMVGAFIFSFLFSIFIKLFIYMKNFCCGDTSKSLNKNEDRLSENSFRNILLNANEISIIPYALSLFIVITTIIYFLSLPYSIFLLIFFSKNEYYSYCQNFSLLYFFVIINTLAGLILFYVLIIVVFAKRDGSFRQRSFYIDDNNLNILRNEIRGAMQRAEE